MQPLLCSSLTLVGYRSCILPSARAFDWLGSPLFGAARPSSDPLQPLRQAPGAECFGFQATSARLPPRACECGWPSRWCDWRRSAFTCSEIEVWITEAGRGLQARQRHLTSRCPMRLGSRDWFRQCRFIDVVSASLGRDPDETARRMRRSPQGPPTVCLEQGSQSLAHCAAERALIPSCRGELFPDIGIASVVEVFLRVPLGHGSARSSATASLSPGSRGVGWRHRDRGSRWPDGPAQEGGGDRVPERVDGPSRPSCASSCALSAWLASVVLSSWRRVRHLTRASDGRHRLRRLMHLGAHVACSLYMCMCNSLSTLHSSRARYRVWRAGHVLSHPALDALSCAACRNGAQRICAVLRCTCTSCKGWREHCGVRGCAGCNLHLIRFKAKHAPARSRRALHVSRAIEDAVTRFCRETRSVRSTGHDLGPDGVDPVGHLSRFIRFAHSPVDSGLLSRRVCTRCPGVRRTRAFCSSGGRRR